jgi:cytochrome c553
MKKTLIIIACTFALLTAGAVQAGDAEAGKKKSENCVGCHGMGGKSNNPMYPNLAGQKKAYLVKAMKAYRDGGREDPMMSSFAKGLSDEDIEDLAAYYSSVK